MKGKKLFLPIALLSLLFSVGLAACNGGGNGGGGNQTSQAQPKITVSAADNKTSLILGESVQLTASVDGVTWESEHTDIATVSAGGLVESKAVGTTKILAKKNGYRDGSISIKVDLEKITVTAEGNATSLVVGTTLKLNASKEGVAWASSDASIATVDNSGTVTGLKFGEVTITASKEGFNPGTISLNVTRPAATAILHWEQADHYSADGEWTSSGRGPGETPIYTKTGAGASDDTCVAYFGAGDKETLSFNSDAAVKAELVVTMGNYSAFSDLSTVEKVYFNDDEISMAGVAYDPMDGGTTGSYKFNGVSLGEVTLKNGENKLVFEFLASAPYLDDLEIYAESAANITIIPAAEKDPVVVNEESLTIVEGKTAQITSSMTGLAYKSNSVAIATVDETGLVTGVKVGETTISVSKDGYKTIKVPVTVTEAEGVFMAPIQNVQGENITTRTSQNLSEPYNYIVDAWEANAVGTLEVDVATAGTYNLYMRCRASGGYNSTTSDDLATCMEIKVNGAALTLSGTVSGSSFTDYLLGEVTLVAGKTTIEIKCLTTVPTINLFRFIPKA